ncbi:MAG: hypothetical protein NTX59_00610 [Elusimicrobia bacterium]|nr:hypothetical protein [Elusimicrobiota bacterium]
MSKVIIKNMRVAAYAGGYFKSGTFSSKYEMCSGFTPATRGIGKAGLREWAFYCLAGGQWNMLRHEVLYGQCHKLLREDIK